jgi:hypothetical protein
MFLKMLILSGMSGMKDGFFPVAIAHAGYMPDKAKYPA